MSARLILVRHGETDGNADGRTQGRRDAPLNARGRQQAAAIAEYLRARSPVAVYSSASSRCLDTAAMIATRHGLPVATDERLGELDQGVLDGLTGEEMRRDHAAFLQRWRSEDPAGLRMPGGESMGEAQRRMVAVCEEIAGTHAGSEIVVVSHNLATRALLCHALGVPLAAFRRIRHEVGAVAELQARSDAPWTVIAMNEQCHLPVAKAAEGVETSTAVTGAHEAAEERNEGAQGAPTPESGREGLSHA